MEYQFKNIRPSSQALLRAVQREQQSEGGGWTSFIASVALHLNSSVAKSAVRLYLDDDVEHDIAQFQKHLSSDLWNRIREAMENVCKNFETHKNHSEWSGRWKRWNELLTSIPRS